MPDLIILGNRNRFTFANSIVAADKKALNLFNARLDWIYVLHSPESLAELSRQTDWINYIDSFGIRREQLIEKVVEVRDSADSIRSFLDYMERTLKGLPEEADLLVDLTNGTSFQKTLLSVVTYILDIRHQYMIDIGILSSLTNDRGFLPQELLVQAYVAAPDSTLLDSVAYLNVSEMTRYRRVVETQTKRYVAIDPTGSDPTFFTDNLVHSIRLKMQGDRKRANRQDIGSISGAENVVYRIAAASMATSIEDLVRLLITKLIATNPSQYAKLTLGQRLKLIESKVEQNAPPEFDQEFFRLFNNFMLYLRNSATHKGRLLTDFERFKAELALKMSFPFIEFYTDTVYPVLVGEKSDEQPMRVTRISSEDIRSDEVLYYGLDGDDTGSILEGLLMSSGDERACAEHSRLVSKAIDEICKQVKRDTGFGSIIFAAGDDLLFKGRYQESQLRELQALYGRTTRNLTCSIGYGRTLQEVFVALKWAKTMPGKNAIVGVKLA